MQMMYYSHNQFHLFSSLGVPSPNRLSSFEQSDAKKQTVSPLVHTVPLLLQSVNSEDE